MNALDGIRLVARREIVERARSKGFLVSTAVTLLVIVAVAVLPAILADDGPTTYDVGVTGPDAADLAARLPLVAAAVDDDVELRVRTVDEDEADDLIEDGTLDAVVTGDEVVVDEELGNRLGLIVQEASRQVRVEAVLAEADVPDDVARTVLAPDPLRVRSLDPDDVDDTRESIVFVGTLLLYGQLLGYGYSVANGIVEEKASRVVELLLAKLRPAHLLTGKIIGIGLLGLAQLVLLVAAGLAAVALAGEVDLPPGIIGVAVEVLAWFVLGYAFYSALFAAGGALASRAEELQNTTMPISLVVVGSFIAAVTAGGDPGGTVARIATFVPPSAPMVLPIRSAAGEIAAWEVAVSVALLVAAIVLVVRLSARIYAGGALHFRGQLDLRQALRRVR